MRIGKLDRLGAALILALLANGAQAQSFVPRTDYEALIEAPKPIPAIPASLTGIVTAPTADRLVVQGLDGGGISVDIEWYEPAEFKLFPGGRFLGFSYGGYEAYGYVLVDRAMRGESAVFDTGQEPVFSPDGRFTAAAEFSESGFGNLNGIALWEILPGSTVRRLFTDALPFGWEWQVEGWARPDCVAVSAITEEWAPQSQEEYESTRRTAPRRHYALTVGEAGIALVGRFDQPGCPDEQPGE